MPYALLLSHFNPNTTLPLSTHRVPAVPGKLESSTTADLSLRPAAEAMTVTTAGGVQVTLSGETVAKLIPQIHAPPADTPAREILDHAREIFQTKYDGILRSFLEEDRHQRGFLSRNIVLRILEGHGLCMTGVASSKLFHHVDSSRDGDIRYDKLLFHYTGTMAQ